MNKRNLIRHVREPISKYIVLTNILLLLLFPSALRAGQFRIDHVSWHIEADSRRDYSLADLRRYHAEYVAAEKTVFGQLGLVPPLTSRIIVCRGAWLFTRLTGLPAQVAGVWLPARGTIVLQDLDALAARGILQRTLEHELTHAALSALRAERGLPVEPRSFYLDEMFCQLEYPLSGSASVETGRDLFVRCRTHEQLAMAFEQTLRGNPSNGDCIAAMRSWGLYLRRQRGRNFLLEAAITGSGDSSQLNRLYSTFWQELFSVSD